jgi:hypothetical protein
MIIYRVNILGVPIRGQINERIKREKEKIQRIKEVKAKNN